MSKSSKHNKKKKVNYKFLVIIGVAIVVLITIVAVHLLKKDDSKVFTSYKESLALNGDLTASLIYSTKVKFSNNSDNNNYYYRQSDKLNVSDMSSDIIYNIIAYRLERLGELNDGIVEESLVKEQFLVVFGNNVKYDSVASFEYRCGKMIYDKNYKGYEEAVYYIMEKNRSCNLSDNIVEATVGSFVYDDRIEIIQAVGFVGKDGTYFDYELKNKVTDQVLDEYTMLGNDHLFERYKYVFNYDSDNDVYYFESIEKHEGDI